VHLGFGFSAGLFDYVLNFSLSTNPLLLIPVGLGYFALYFVLFRWCILRFDLKTLGREPDDTGVAGDAGQGGDSAAKWIRALGEAANLRAVEACTTRLRLTVTDPARIDEAALKSLGSRGVLKLADGAVQVVVGPIADQLAAEIRAALRAGATGAGDAGVLLDALGGAGNLAKVELRASRLVLEVADPAAVRESRLLEAGFRGVTRISASTWHVIAGPDAAALASRLRDG
jgi:PTS system N-acetylglucosamine-specific IIC component